MTTSTASLNVQVKTGVDQNQIRRAGGVYSVNYGADAEAISDGVTITLEPAGVYESNSVEFTDVLVINTSGPIVFAGTTVLGYELDMTIRQLAALDDPLASYTLTNNGSTTVTVRLSATTRTASGSVIIQSPRPRVHSIVTATEITIDADLFDQLNVTAQATDTIIEPLTGTPYDGQRFVLRIKDNGVSHNLQWNSIYRFFDQAAPTTTVAGKIMYAKMIYNSADSKWDVTILNEYVIEF